MKKDGEQKVVPLDEKRRATTSRMKAVKKREIDKATLMTSNPRSDDTRDGHKATNQMTRGKPHPLGHPSIFREEDIG